MWRKADGPVGIWIGDGFTLFMNGQRIDVFHAVGIYDASQILLNNSSMQLSPDAAAGF